MINSYGILTTPGTIRFERLLPGSIEQIWTYLTESEKKAEWLASGQVECRIGGMVKHHFKHSTLCETDDPIPDRYKHLEEGASYTGRVTKCEIPHLLSYIWAEEDGEESEVTFKLVPTEGNNTHLILTHKNIGNDRSILIGAASGWHTHLGILIDKLNGRKPKGFWKVHKRMEREYELRLLQAHD